MSESSLYPFQLMDVRLYEAVIERLETDESEAPPAAKADGGETQVPLGIELTVQKLEKQEVSVFLSLQFSQLPDREPAFRLCFTLDGLFATYADLDDIEEGVWEDFRSLSAITLLWPYARECAQSFFHRMRVDFPPLPTLNRLTLATQTEEVEHGEDSDDDPVGSPPS